MKNIAKIALVATAFIFVVACANKPVPAPEAKEPVKAMEPVKKEVKKHHHHKKAVKAVKKEMNAEADKAKETAEKPAN
jgi:hypothetical protein